MKIDVTFLRDLDHGGHQEQPQQVANQLTKFINAAKSSLHIAIYDFRLTKPELFAWHQSTHQSLALGAIASRLHSLLDECLQIKASKKSTWW